MSEFFRSFLEVVYFSRSALTKWQLQEQNNIENFVSVVIYFFLDWRPKIKPNKKWAGKKGYGVE